MSAVASLVRAPPAKLDPLLDTTSARSLGIWHQVLTLQVDLFLADEVEAFHGSPGWARASTVLEVGCGNGRYLAGLRRAFPRKHYLGVDLAAGLVALADDNYADARMRFAVADFLDQNIGERFDAVVMRFIVQHLSDFPTVLVRAADCLNPGGSLFIIEPDLTNSANTPRTPAFEAMLVEYGRQAADRARLRVRLDTLPALIAASSGWVLVRDERLQVANDGPFSGGNVLRLYQAWIDLCEHQGSFAFDFSAVREELTAWARSGSGRSCIGLRMLEVRRPVGGRFSRRPGQ